MKKNEKTGGKEIREGGGRGENKSKPFFFPYVLHDKVCLCGGTINFHRNWFLVMS